MSFTENSAPGASQDDKALRFAADFPGFPEPYWYAPDAALYLGDVRAALRGMPDRSVHCVVTSPPYWGLRKYIAGDDPSGAYEIGSEALDDCASSSLWSADDRCGACFVCHMVAVFREVRRVLRDDGTLWLNLGDTFDGGQRMVPAATALALRADGWKLCQDIIWYAPNKLPESVTNRCGKSHEHVFLMAKRDDYYFDNVAIMVPGSGSGGGAVWSKEGGDQHRRYDRPEYPMVNKRDVWTVPIASYPGAHFATFNPKLIEPCIAAGTSEAGCCAACGKPYERVVARVGAVKVEGDIMEVSNIHRDRSMRDNRNGVDSTLDSGIPERRTVGWRQTCACTDAGVVPCTVLDPFVGSGTTVATSLEMGRRGVGIDLSEKYLRENAVPRVSSAVRGSRLSGGGGTAAPVVVAADTPPPPELLR